MIFLVLIYQIMKFHTRLHIYYLGLDRPRIGCSPELVQVPEHGVHKMTFNGLQVSLVSLSCGLQCCICLLRIEREIQQKCGLFLYFSKC